MNRLLFAGLTVGLLAVNFSCQRSTEATTESDMVTDSKEAMPKTFGADFAAAETLVADQLLASYESSQLEDTVRTTLRGTVNAVCQKKGCWMTIAAGKDTEMMVKFKDYGFFVPLDISGREVVMHGKAYYQVTPVDELRHYAEDAGKSAEEVAGITEDKRELHFLADGVKLLAEKEG